MLILAILNIAVLLVNILIHKTNIPLPFLLLVVVSTSVLGYEIYESLDFDAEALNQCMNNSIDKIVIYPARPTDFQDTMGEKTRMSLRTSNGPNGYEPKGETQGLRL